MDERNLRTEISSTEDSDENDSNGSERPNMNSAKHFENDNIEIPNDEANASCSETLELSATSESSNLTDEEKSRLAVLLTDSESKPRELNAGECFAFSKEDMTRWKDIDEKLKILEEIQDIDDIDDSSQDGYITDEGEKEWFNYLKSSKLQQIEKQLKELQESSDNETSE